MSRKSLWFVAVVSLFSAAAAAEPRRWVIDVDGFFEQQPGKPRLAIDLPGWQWAHEPYACPPAVAIGPRGEAVVTSNVLPVLWKIDPGTLAVSVHRLELDADTHKDVGFSGLVYSGRHGAYFAASELHGTLWRIDPLLRRAQKIALSAPLHGTCSMPMHLDGRSIHLAPDQRSAYVRVR